GVIVVQFALNALNPERPFSYEEMDKMIDDGKIDEKDVPRLLAGLERNDENVRIKSAETLAKLGVKAVEPLRPKLSNHNAKARFAAVQTLAMMKPGDAASAAADLVTCTADNDAEVRRKAIYVLGRLQGQGDGVFTAIVKGLNDSDLEVCQEAMSAL